MAGSRYCLVLLMLLACESDGVPDREPATVTPAQLSALRWIEGTWRAESTFGETPLFFERYAFADDSTVMVVSYPDSTLQSPETTYFELRNRRFATRGGGPFFAAESLTAKSVSFMPLAGATNRFTWEYTGPDEWTARLSAPPEGDQPERLLVYHMLRVKQ